MNLTIGEVTRHGGIFFTRFYCTYSDWDQLEVSSSLMKFKTPSDDIVINRPPPFRWHISTASFHDFCIVYNVYIYLTSTTPEMKHYIVLIINFLKLFLLSNGAKAWNVIFHGNLEDNLFSSNVQIPYSM